MCQYKIVFNSLQLVDGCVTNDGDAFLYGALTVYRNFTMNPKVRTVQSLLFEFLVRKRGSVYCTCSSVYSVCCGIILRVI